MGICLTILPFVPAANIFMKVGFVIAERTLLLPSVGYCFLVVYGFKKLVNFYKGNQKVCTNSIKYTLDTAQKYKEMEKTQTIRDL